MESLASLAERLPPGTLTTHPGELAAHARDMWALAMLREARGEKVPPPAGLAFPGSTEEVATIVRWANETGTAIVPRGKGSGLGGGAQALKRSVVLDLTRMDRILSVDDISQTVSAQAGARGPDVEAALAPHGLTIGHYPESFDISTVGGWIASASAGYASAGYGSIENLVLGMAVVLPDGEVLQLRPLPRSGAGPDLRRMFVGSEGILGVITEATLSAFRAPGDLAWETFRPSSFQSGVALVREVTQRRFDPLAVRLMDDADATLAFSAFGYQGAPVLIVGFDAGSPGAEARRARLGELAREMGARAIGPELAEHWWQHRHDSVALYAGVMGEERTFGDGVVADTLGAAALWRAIPRLYDEIRGALLDTCDIVTCNLANPYPSGASLRFGFVLRAADDREAERVYLDTWKEAVARCLRAGGTPAHHGDVGLLLAGSLAMEVGEAGAGALARIRTALDPAGVMNPEKLVRPRP